MNLCDKYGLEPLLCRLYTTLSLSKELFSPNPSVLSHSSGG
jgi:hypothetical protein